jgi:hypothetical protein
MTIAETHAETQAYYKDLAQNHKQTCDQFRAFFAKFDVIYDKLKTRDRALAKFIHYFEKLRKIKEDRSVRNSVAGDVSRASKDAEYLARNEKKYQVAFATFQQQNNWLYNEVTDLIRNKYKALTPIVIRFISVAQSFFGKAGSSFAKLTNIQDRGQAREMQEVQPQSLEPASY